MLLEVLISLIFTSNFIHQPSHTYEQLRITMSRRVISAVSMQASRVLAGAARPTFATTSRIVRPAVVSQTIAKRSYHEKGTSTTIKDTRWE